MSSTLYTDPRLVALYDTLNPIAADTAFYLTLAEGKNHIIDLGCGTGLLACELAARGHRVVAIDPAPEMLHVARHRREGEHVQWIEGDARALAVLPPADLLLMTGHVAQVFLDDTTFLDTLKAARYALRNGGELAFESRNPAARAWESWTPTKSRRLVDVDGIGEVEVWQDDASGSPESGIRFNTYYRFKATDETLTSASELRFRTLDGLAALLESAGFSHLSWQGDWNGAPVSASSRELIVVAR
ncbi:class I SAM-dependent methyltransferase [Caballeronia sp. SEWSISQ10-4 2]|uniref:class I SAM-dependent methyltransferase n=1 Tax=Caballeronia sp. SEWSISQ10-4 2 TaxID=2937438 RepID=UPI00264BC938|nr:class I SAM-dependent methyltransferase [Caballeronia sp. SEWSISQ10-4 2]MDN7176570.1 class I SAM-dependent methyltransferase [Caballeronia sp. SEWSISQ10-4 2]